METRARQTPGSLCLLGFRWFCLLIFGVVLAVVFLNRPAPTARAQGGDLVNHPERGMIYTGLKLSSRPDCRPGFEMVVPNFTRPICTHGPDPAPKGVSIRESVHALAANQATTTVVCDSDGQTGKRVQLIYARAADMPDRYAEYVASVQQWASDMDTIFSASAQETGGERHVRFVHDAACQPLVENVVLSSQGDDAFLNTILELSGLGYKHRDRDYLVFMDANIYCGIATIANDDSRGDGNLHNTGPFYARVDSACWSGEIAAHELMHNLGGVQLSAPHATLRFHCYDDYDRMCYRDSVNTTIQYVCEWAQEYRFDCNHDDYYNTNPAPGSYLATHWNPAENHFLIRDLQPPPTVPPSPTATPPPTVTPSPPPTDSALIVDTLITGRIKRRGQFVAADTFKRGQTVVVRSHVSDAHGANVSDAKVSLRIDKPNTKVLCRIQVMTDSAGNAEGSCAIPPKSPAGKYAVELIAVEKMDLPLDPESIKNHPFSVAAQ